MHDSTLDTSSNHGGIIFPLEMFRASMLASALAEGLIAKVKNAVGAQLRMTRHATSPLVLARIEGDVVGGDEAAFWEENLDLTLYASQVLPRECFAYYAAQVPARKQGLLIAQRGQVIAGDQVTEDQMPPEATELDWPLPRLCEQLRITVAELAVDGTSCILERLDDHLVEPSAVHEAHLVVVQHDHAYVDVFWGPEAAQGARRLFHEQHHVSKLELRQVQ